MAVSSWKSKEGLAPSLRGDTWFKVCGESRNDTSIPLVVVHGGPGLTHDYLLDLSRLARDREVIFYDQIGNGRSSPVGQFAADAINLQSLVDELEGLLKLLKLDVRGYVLLGHSVGGCIALEHVLRRPDKIAGVILADTFSSSETMQRGMRAWLTNLREEGEQSRLPSIRRNESSSPDTISTAEFSNFFSRHVCRVPPPDHLLHSLKAATLYPEVQHKLLGTDLFRWDGELALWSVTDRLSEIKIPVLAYGGAWDEASPDCLDEIVAHLSSSRRVTFAQSSHLPHIEQTDECLLEIEKFLKALEVSHLSEGAVPSTPFTR